MATPPALRPSAALLGAHLALSAAIDRRAVDPLGHDTTQLDLLLRLSLEADQEARAADLACDMLLSPSHVSRRIDRAAEAGYVCREPDPDDRRAHRVCLTDAGEAVVDEFRPRLDAVLAEVIFDTLTPTQIDTLVDLLGRVEAAARKAAA